MRTQIKILLICSVVIVFNCVISSYGITSQVRNDNQISNNSPPNEEIIKLYQELIDIRQQAVEQCKYLIELGQSSLLELIEAQTKAAEARIQLAEFQGKKEIVIEELQNLIQVIADKRNLLRREVEVGQRPQTWINEIDARLLETKIRLAKLNQKKPDITNVSQNESELRKRLNIVNQITDLKMKNDALSVLAINASKSGIVDFTSTILGQINEINLKNQTSGVCAINLAKLGKIQEALAIVNTINDLSLKNTILVQLATMK